MDKLPIVLAAWMFAMIGIALLDELDDAPDPLVCDEPDIIAVEETAHGVIVRCGPVEVHP